MKDKVREWYKRHTELKIRDGWNKEELILY